MQSPFPYDVHEHLEAERSRERERDHSHIRALRSASRTDGTRSRLVGRLARLARVWRRPAIVADPHELTQVVCRLADGAAGRVAVRRSGRGWVAVCVATLP